jgi:hypothetical protein
MKLVYIHDCFYYTCRVSLSWVLANGSFFCLITAILAALDFVARGMGLNFLKYYPVRNCICRCEVDQGHMQHMAPYMYKYMKKGFLPSRAWNKCSNVKIGGWPWTIVAKSYIKLKHYIIVQINFKKTALLTRYRSVKEIGHEQYFWNALDLFLVDSNDFTDLNNIPSTSIIVNLAPYLKKGLLPLSHSSLK